MIYFMQITPDGPIKIGYSRNPKRRLIDLQLVLPYELRILGVREGSRDDERTLHRELARFRLRGEWFTPAPEILEFLTKPIPPQAVARSTNLIISRAIELLGSQAKLAEAMGASQQTVSHLLTCGRKVSAEQACAVERATCGLIQASELRPDLFLAPSLEAAA